MKIPIPKMPVPILISVEYLSMPNKNKGKPTRISIKEKKSENALGSVITIKLSYTSSISSV